MGSFGAAQRATVATFAEREELSMAKFSHVIVRRPGKSLCDGITSAPELGKPIYEKAIKQHDAYIEALKQCGVDVTVLPAMEEYPDSCFVEDTAVITRCGAIIDNPGAGTRNGEAKEMEPTIRQFFDDDHIAHITAPGTLEGGDVMMVGDHFYVGRSARTNEEGIRQFIRNSRGLGPFGQRGAAGVRAAPEDRRELPGRQQHARFWRVQDQARLREVQQG